MHQRLFTIGRRNHFPSLSLSTHGRRRIGSTRIKVDEAHPAKGRRLNDKHGQLIVDEAYVLDLYEQKLVVLQEPVQGSNPLSGGCLILIQRQWETVEGSNVKLIDRERDACLLLLREGAIGFPDWQTPGGTQYIHAAQGFPAELLTPADYRQRVGEPK